MSKKITDFFPKNPKITAKELSAWRGLIQLTKKNTMDVAQQQTIGIVRQKSGMTQNEKQALRGLYLMSKTTPRQVAARKLASLYGKERWAAMPKENKDILIQTEIVSRHRENEKRFLDKLETLRRIRETRLKKDLDSLRDIPVHVAPALKATITVQELGDRLRKLRQKKTPTPPKTTTPKKKGARSSPRLKGLNEKFALFHKKLNNNLITYRENLEKTGRFTPKQIELGLERMETDSLNHFYNQVLTQLDEDLFTMRISKILGMTKKGLEKRYDIFMKEGYLPEIVSKKRKRKTATKRKKKEQTQDHDDNNNDDDGDLPQPVKRKVVALM